MIYLVRHAESAMNGRYCGSINADLSAKGESQLAGLTQKFAEIPLDLCYHSDLLRAERTARAVAAHGVPRVPVAEMREMGFGEWEGLTFAEASARAPELYQNWMNAPHCTPVPGGESFVDFVDRVRRFAKNLEGAQKNIAVVAHAGSLSALTMVLLQRPLSEFWQWLLQPAEVRRLQRGAGGVYEKV